jgi:hypothetical protein
MDVHAHAHVPSRQKDGGGPPEPELAPLNASNPDTARVARPIATRRHLVTEAPTHLRSIHRTHLPPSRRSAHSLNDDGTQVAEYLKPELEKQLGF